MVLAPKIRKSPLQTPALKKSPKNKKAICENPPKNKKDHVQTRKGIDIHSCVCYNPNKANGKGEKYD